VDARELLIARGAAELPHPGGTLLAHLERVHATLRAWAEPDHVALAGLTHAAYGTDGFPHALLDLTERELLRDAVGEAAEQLVFVYGGCDRGVVYPRLGEPSPAFRNRFTDRDDHLDASGLSAFAAITAANEIDVATHNPEVLARHRDGLWTLFGRLRRHLPDPAWQACVSTFAPAADA
jgi:hypothetical protein